MKRILAHSIVLVIILLSLTTTAAGAPASLDKTASELAVAAPSRTADARAVIYPCHFEVRVTDEETGDPIRGVAVTVHQGRRSARLGGDDRKLRDAFGWRSRRGAIRT